MIVLMNLSLEFLSIKCMGNGRETILIKSENASEFCDHMIVLMYLSFEFLAQSIWETNGKQFIQELERK